MVDDEQHETMTEMLRSLGPAGARRRASELQSPHDAPAERFEPDTLLATQVTNRSPALNWVRNVLVALIVLCVALSAIVWWELLKPLSRPD